MNEAISSITKFPKMFDKEGVEIVRICASCHRILTPRNTGKLGQFQPLCNKCTKNSEGEKE